MTPTASPPTNLRTILCAVIIAIGTIPMIWASHGWATAPRGPSGQPGFGPGLVCFVAWVLMAGTHVPCTGYLLYSACTRRVRNRAAANSLGAAAFVLLLLPVLYVYTLPG
ncbi:hypothetical protein ACFFTM_05490 [Pseudoduganella plicata]|uniref:Uncharacterized protein n=1 Tax=Pseudoduganella plicata TaxID=321984 RepID=A0A4P7BK75_9BURK|nr:hypothetical protein [Pseudoduganella plicata]QBQ38682.1 hypothetical protein E1742_22800 [Pseudoduganella plicata]GGY84231.1 hypothetical protein GCM10007388_16630 [Pseudoduganella plicata]